MGFVCIAEPVLAYLLPRTASSIPSFGNIASDFRPRPKRSEKPHSAFPGLKSRSDSQQLRRRPEGWLYPNIDLIRVSLNKVAAPFTMFSA
jgi:hypothetical protein